MQSLGEQDAKYIYKVRNFVRYTEIASRGMLSLVAGFLLSGYWVQVYWVFLKL